MSRVPHLFLLLTFCVGMFAQQQGSSPNPSSSSSDKASQPNQSGQSPSSPGNSGGSVPSEAKPAKKTGPDLAPPRSDRVNADDLGDGIGEKSSKYRQIGLNAPS